MRIKILRQTWFLSEVWKKITYKKKILHSTSLPYITLYVIITAL